MHIYTILGCLAVIIWATNIGFSRILVEQIGGFYTCGIEMTVSGILLLLVEFLKNRTIKPLFHLKKKYYSVCGFFFFFYMFLFYLAMHLCNSREQILIVSAANYLWPVLTIVFGIPVLHHKCRLFPLILGILLTIIGTFGVSLSGQNLSREQLEGTALLAFGLSSLGAVSWALYSCFVIRYLGEKTDDPDALPLFMLVSGVIMLVIGRLFGPLPKIGTDLLPAVIYTILFPGVTAYFFWDIGIQKGNDLIVTFLSLFTVVLSMAASALVLKISISREEIIFSFLITLGALLCKFSEKHNNS